jgi:adenylate cyclase 5
MSDSFDHLLQYARERDRMLSAYFVCSGFVYMIVVLAIAITLAFSFG